MADFVESARKELAAWLASQLSGAFPTCVVMDRWPAAGRQLPAKAVSITVLGEPDVEPHSAVIHAPPTPTTGHLGLQVYSYGRITLDMQLDVWTTNPADRYALTKAVSDAVNTHPSYSLPIAGAWPEFRRYPGVARYLTDFYNVVASYHFAQAAAPEESEDGALTKEYRAVFTGEARFYAVTQEQVAVLQQMIVDWRVNGAHEVRTVP